MEKKYILCPAGAPPARAPAAVSPPPPPPPPRGPPPGGVGAPPDAGALSVRLAPGGREVKWSRPACPVTSSVVRRSG
ncbi:hypothetical protein [Nocardia abscessus]|uniref:hypothetical protein n=1 Tax=Nocardia abscessus TaxID=120957 RepID=UPI002454FF39|nr:hypothetical protein [Nocardia abscessus]